MRGGVPTKVVSEIFTLGVLKAYHSLLPLIAANVVAVSLTSIQLYSLAVNNPDVHWTDRGGDMANTKWPINKQARHRVFDKQTSEEYAKMKFPAERPDIENMWKAYLKTKAPPPK